jgi:hypothetical protein
MFFSAKGTNGRSINRTRRQLIVTAFILFAIQVSGCSSLEGQSFKFFAVDKFAVYRPVDNKSSGGVDAESTYQKKDNQSSALVQIPNSRSNSHAANNPESGEDLQESPEAVKIEQYSYYKALDNKSSSENKNKINEIVENRNRLQIALITLSDEKCEDHKTRIVAIGATVNYTFSQLTTLLAGAGSIVAGPVGAKSLSAGAAASTAAQSHFNQNFYQNFIGPAIVREIAVRRSLMLSAMKEKRVRSYDAYTRDEVVEDVLAYHSECSFYRGLQHLTQEREKISDPLVNLNSSIDSIKQSILFYEEKIKTYDDSGNLNASEEMKKRLLELHRNLAAQERVKQVVRFGISAPPPAADPSTGLSSAPATGSAGGTVAPSGGLTSPSGTVSSSGTTIPPVR